MGGGLISRNRSFPEKSKIVFRNRSFVIRVVCCNPFYSYSVFGYREVSYLPRYMRDIAWFSEPVSQINIVDDCVAVVSNTVYFSDEFIPGCHVDLSFNKCG